MARSRSSPSASEAAPVDVSLPPELTTFIGREREVAELRERLHETRLVTLTGAAGSGKTRLALRAVALRGADAPPARWVELATLRDPGLVPAAVAEAVGIGEELRPGDTAALSRLLRPHRLLLVLDNCEHLVDACAVLVDLLLRSCPHVSVLATSREALGVPGERAWLVPPLGLPGDSEDAASSDAIRLFLDRARDTVPAFQLTDDNRLAVVEICRRLDGIPLAIELAAARVKILSPGEIRDRLDDVFHLLPAGGRTAVPRHRTLRAAIDWSHDLLPEDARTLFRRLSVFRGGFDLDAAEAVTEAASLPAAQVLELVARLVDRSLLTVGERQGVSRYAYLDAVRQYAAGQLAASGEEEAIRASHAAWLLARVEAAEPHFTGRERREWVARLQVDLDNIRSALSWSYAQAPTLHVRLVGKLWWFWFSSRHWAEGGRWIDDALALTAAAEPSLDRASLLFAAGALAALQVRTPVARPLLEEAAALATELGDGRLEAYALNYLGMTYAGEASPEGLEPCRRAERWFRDHDDLYGLRLSLLLQGSAALGRGDLVEAEARNREGVEVATRFGQAREVAVALQNLAVVHLTQGRLDEAEAALREALSASREDPSYYFISVGVGYLGELAARRGRPGEGARLLGAAAGLRERVGATAFPIDARRQAEVIEGVRSQLGDDGFRVAWETGLAAEPEALLAELTGRSPENPQPTLSGIQGAVVQAEAMSEKSRPEESEWRANGSEHGLDPALRVEALGRVVIYVEGTRLEPEAWPFAKPRELLLHLLLHPEGATRDRIGEALWPEAPRSRVKNSFHVALHHLRKTLGRPTWVVLEGERYRIDPTLRWELDADAFAEEARRALRAEADPVVRNGGGSNATPGVDPVADGECRIERLRRVLRLYRGDLLEGEGGRWVDEHRDRLRRVYLDVALALGTALEPVRPDEAVALYNRLALREELDEEIHRRLMQAQARAGDRPGALRHYERLVTSLQDVLEAEPEPATVALYDQIRRGSW